MEYDTDTDTRWDRETLHADSPIRERWQVTLAGLADSDILLIGSSWKLRTVVRIADDFKTPARPERKREPNAEVLIPEIEDEFLRHVERWRKQTQIYSSIARKIAHPDYLAIIGMQKKVIPLLLRELAERPTYWFAALRTLANDEKPPEESNSFDATVKAWLDWGRRRGYLQERGPNRS
jgi:hypothetical protein